MSNITNFGELRSFLLDAMVKVSNGGITTTQGNSIASIASQVNKAADVEVKLGRARNSSAAFGQNPLVNPGQGPTCDSNRPDDQAPDPDNPGCAQQLEVSESETETITKTKTKTKAKARPKSGKKK
jgi:hypothetical protein